MKRPVFLTLFCLHTIGYLFAQVSSISVDIEPDDNLKKIVNLICSRQQYLIAYPPHLSELSPEATGHFYTNSLEDLLSELFPNKLQIKKIDEVKYLVREQSPTIENYDLYQTIKGRVIDEKKMGLADILIYQDGNHQTISQEDGTFKLNLTADTDEHPIYFQGLGFQTRSLLPTQIDNFEEIVLQDQPYDIATINVIEALPAIRTNSISTSLYGTTKISKDHVLSSLYASDLIKKMQLLPGVQATDDLSAQIKIRGSQGNESLILLDGIPLFGVDHFYGIFSSANGNYLSNGQLYKNALPIQYGGKTGGMLEMNSPSVADQVKAITEIDLLSSSVSLFAPIHSKVYWSMGARTSYLNAADLNSFDLTQPKIDFYQLDNRLMTRSETVETQPQFHFSDINSKLALSLTKHLNLDLNFYASTDKLQNNYNLFYASQINRVKAQSSEVYRNSENWSNTGMSLNTHWQLSPSWQFIGNGYSTRYSNSGSIESLLSINTEAQSFSTGFSNLQDGLVSSSGFHLYLHRSTEKQSFTIGSDYKSSQIDYRFSEDDLTLLAGDDKGNEYTLFAENSWKKNKTTLTLGGRSTYYTRTQKVYTDPKIQISFQASEYFILKASSHYAHQFVRELNYENRLGQSSNYLILSNENRYPVGTSLQFMGGFSFKQSNWNIDVELYHKKLGGVLEYSLLMPGFNQDLGFNRTRSYQVLSGEGEIAGLDLLITKTIKNYQGWIAYTLSKSTRNFKQIRNSLPFPAQDDRRHQLKWINSYDLGKFTISANYIFSSGKPYLAINEIPGEIDLRKITSGKFIKNLPSYQRIDLGVDYHFKLLSKKGTIGVSCFNVSDHDNVKYLQYIFSVPLDNLPGKKANTILGTETTLLGRTPNVRLRLDL
ncbi:MAG: TonB-dependent receptor plug domain-containing protein [Saprospiraceae bacterium]|nr:TonB-dependent receptor plug domain-containing protein [Saprospiraceae bacterium]